MLAMRIPSSKEVYSLKMGLQKHNTDKFTMQAARSASDGGHERDRVVVIICSSVLTNVSVAAFVRGLLISQALGKNTVGGRLMLST